MGLLTDSDWNVLSNSSNSRDLEQQWIRNYGTVRAAPPQVSKPKPGSLLALTDLAPHLPVLDSANVLADGAVVAWEPEPPEPEVLVAASVPSNDLYAPPKRFCGDRGDCDKLPHEVRDVGRLAGSKICQTVRLSKARQEAAKLAAEASGHAGPGPTEELSVWSLRVTRPVPVPEAVEALPAAIVPLDADITINYYFIIAHIMYSPIRIILLPLDATDINGRLMLRFRFAVNGELVFTVLYKFIEEAAMGWVTDSMQLLHFPVWDPCQWDTLLIDTEHIHGKLIQSLWPTIRRKTEKTSSGLPSVSTYLASQNAALNTLSKMLLEKSDGDGDATCGGDSPLPLCDGDEPGVDGVDLDSEDDEARWTSKLINQWEQRDAHQRHIERRSTKDKDTISSCIVDGSPLFS